MENIKKIKRHSEINWPLGKADELWLVKRLESRWCFSALTNLHVLGSVIRVTKYKISTIFGHPVHIHTNSLCSCYLLFIISDHYVQSYLFVPIIEPLIRSLLTLWKGCENLLSQLRPLTVLTKKLSIYNIIWWFAGLMGQMTRWPSVWCFKYYFFFKKIFQNSVQKPFHYFFFS